VKILIGGYTKHDSKGIYELKLSGIDAQAELTDEKNIVEVGGPTYFQKDGDLIITINNTGSKGGISLFKLTSTGYKEVDSYLTDGASPAYVGISKTKKVVYTANYHTGVISVFSYSDDKLSLIASATHTAQTLGPRDEQKDSAHPHFFDETPKGNLVCCDLGNDSVTFYQLNVNKLEQIAVYQNEPGFGTRHIAFSKDGNYFYVAGELSSKVNVVKFDENNWKFESIQTISTIPEDWTKHNGAAAIRISKDGKYLYVSNRGNDSIAVFVIQPDHTLKLIQRISTFGEFPRDFNWDDEQRYVVATNQNTNNATLYLRDADNGILNMIQNNVFVPEGTRVLFD